MDAERNTSIGEVVYLLTELRSGQSGPVHEIGSRARVLDVEGDRLTLAVAVGRGEDIITCPPGLVGRRRRSLASRRHFGRAGVSPAA